MNTLKNHRLSVIATCALLALGACGGGSDGAPGIAGSVGANGAVGAPGLAGSSLLSGTGNPSSDVGNNGDFFLNATTGTLFGPKVGGSWPTKGLTLMGATGPAGVPGPVLSPRTSLQTATNPAGTPAFMAPEQAEGKTSTVGPAADIYSLGAILYDLICGRPPFVGSVVEVLHSVRAVEPVAPRRRDAAIPRDLETICLKALAKDPTVAFLPAAILARRLKARLHQSHRFGHSSFHWDVFHSNKNSLQTRYLLRAAASHSNKLRRLIWLAVSFKTLLANAEEAHIVISPLIRRGSSRSGAARTTPSPPSDGGEGRGEEVL